MKIFITGSSGYIGNELVRHLSRKHEIVRYDLAEGQDILDLDKLKRNMEGCEVVVHLAAIRGPDESKTFSDYFKTNCQGTLHVAKAAAKNGIKRIVYASSTGYYGLENGVPFIKPLKEPNPIVTQHVKAEDLDCRDCDIAYSTSKVIAEQILANYGLRKKLEVVILRLGPIGGKRGERWSLEGVSLDIDNALLALEKAISAKETLWYEAFTITDNVNNADISKARKILYYNPN